MCLSKDGETQVTGFLDDLITQRCLDAGITIGMSVQK